ncbi:MAG: SIR2 family protein [Erysipelotrichaceae bacterium]|nr:SIR2 family protein [Erysipelotrichaceae bacterium]
MENIKDSTLKAIAFEKEIINILTVKNKNLHFDYDNFQFTDIYAKNQLDLSDFFIYHDFRDEYQWIQKKEKIYIEIKFCKQLRYEEINNIYERIAKNNSNKIFLVLITSAEVDNNFLNNIIVIDYKCIIRLPEIKKIIESFDVYLEEQSRKFKTDYFREFLNLKKSISFALGAGCSINSGISNWSELSETLKFELLYNVIHNKELTEYHNVIRTNAISKEVSSAYDRNSALDIAHFAFCHNHSKSNYYTIIKKALYSHYIPPKSGCNKLIASINNCIKMKNIRVVINYNFDSILEQDYNDKYVSKTDEVIKSKTKIGMCNVYHVHGYIPYDYDGITPVNNLVFSDTDFYNTSVKPSSFCNKKQTDVFRKYNMIFVGLSFTDENLKAQLRKRKNEVHNNEFFCFLKLPSFIGTSIEQSIMENKYKFIMQCYFDTFDVKILWVKEFDEIYKYIDELANM